MSTKEFNYTREWTDAEAFPLLSFQRNWENPDDYPTIEIDERKVRKDMQSLHDEVKDFLNNELIPRVIAEDATVDAWNAMEQARQEAESQRVSAETERTEIESARVQAESARVQAESERAVAESGRVSAEDSRVSAEALREAKEAERSSAEDVRNIAEEGRVITETKRVRAESERRSEFTAMQSAESRRAEAETLRSQSEKSRESAETIRKNNENLRLAAEAKREEAEQARVDSTNGIVAEATRQADRAEDAFHSARSSAEYASNSYVQAREAANTAVASAERSERMADNAETSASEASTSASSASSSKNSAADSAEQARLSAEAAAESAKKAENIAGGDFADRAEVEALSDSVLLKNVQAAMPSSNHWCSIAYGNEKFVSVVDGSMARSTAVAYSIDGAQWFESVLPHYSGSVGYGNGKFVALGPNTNTVCYSVDGTSWLSGPNLPVSFRTSSIAYGSGRFVAVAWGTPQYRPTDEVLYSGDGLTWLRTTLPIAGAWRDVTYGNGKFVAVSAEAIVWSTDGINWTEAAKPSDVQWYTVIYGGDKFVALAYQSNIAAYSIDGTDWTTTTLPTSDDWESISYGNGRFVALSSSSSSRKCIYSSDGIEWTEVRLPENCARSWRDVTFGDGKFVAVSFNSSTVMVSTDGINWSTELASLQNKDGEDVSESVLKALPTPDVAGQIAEHNADTSAHSDIRGMASAASALARFQNGLGNEYVWDKCMPNFAYTEKSITNGDQNSLVFTGSGSSAKFRISNTLQDALLGVYTEQTVTPANRTSLNGKYVRTDAVQYANQPAAYEYIFYIASNATWSIYTNPNGYCFSTGTVYTNIAPAHIHQTYVNSANANAYPNNAYSASDGFIYAALGRLGDALGGAKIATGSYTGTGTYGASNPNSLTFDFEPKLVIVHGLLHYLVAVYSQGVATAVYLSVSKTCWLTWDENALSWQGESAEYQLNMSNAVYNYIAIG